MSCDLYLAGRLGQKNNIQVVCRVNSARMLERTVKECTAEEIYKFFASILVSCWEGFHTVLRRLEKISGGGGGSLRRIDGGHHDSMPRSSSLAGR